LFFGRPGSAVALVLRSPLPSRRIVWRAAYDRLQEAVTSEQFVGRTEELRRLEGAFDHALAGRPEAVLILGEAGVGKTRLVREFSERVATKGPIELEGACLPLAAGPIPYLPLTAALRSLARAVPAPELRTMLGPARTELARLLPELATPGAQEPQQAGGRLGRAVLFEMVLGVAERLAAQTPVILVVEDLQWADHSTLDLLLFLVANVRTSRVLLVATCRLEALRERDDLLRFIAELERRPGIQRIDLAALARREVAQQFASLTGRRAGTLELDALFARSGGNPFLVEQVVDGPHRSDGGLPGRGDVSAALADIVSAKLAALSPEARWIVHVAAVAGGPVSSAVLESVAAIDGMTPTVVRSAIRELIGADVLDVRHAASDEVLAFHHDLLREVAGPPRPRSEEKLIHARYAAVLAERTPTDPATIIRIAHHLFEAGDAERAIPAAIAAGEAAESIYAFPEAVLQYGRALQLWSATGGNGDGSNVRRADVLERAAEAELVLGNATHAVDLLHEALHEPLVVANADRSNVLHGRLRVALWQAGRRSEAIADAEAMLAALPASRGDIARAVAEAHLAALLMEEGDAARSLAIARDAAESTRAAGTVTEEALALGTIGGDLILLGEVSQGLEQLRDVWQRALELGGALGIGVAAERLTAALDDAARYDEAVAVGQEALQTARRMGLERSFAPFVAAALADALERMGRWDEASWLCRDAADGMLQEPARVRLGIVAARIAARRGRFDEADELLAPLAAASVTDAARLALEAVQIERRVAAAGSRHVGSSVSHDPDIELGGSWRTSLGDLACLRARCDADAAEHARAVHDESGYADAQGRANATLRVLDRHWAQAAPEVRPLVAPYRLHVKAEAGRARAKPTRADSAHWAAAREAWETVNRPYEAAYAGLRQAEMALAATGNREAAAALIQQAFAIAEVLKAAPLRDEIESLARRARLSVRAPEDNATLPAETRPSAEPTDDLGLTPREREVLGYVAAGWTNGQIAKALFISPKTASVHVSHILDKLGVEGRIHAATIGVRLGLDNEVAGEPVGTQRPR
jgi:DNA-binding CsgD family transcriptional regulator/tetratricopeptide (TPR) repeat protein